MDNAFTILPAAQLQGENPYHPKLSTDKTKYITTLMNAII